MGELKKILILFLLLVSLLTYTKEFRVISYNLYGGRLTDPIELADSLKKAAVYLENTAASIARIMSLR